MRGKMSRYLAVMIGVLILANQGAYAQATNSRSYNDGIRAGYSKGYNYGYDDGVARRQRNDQYRRDAYRPRGDAYRGDTQYAPAQSRYNQNNFGQDCQRNQMAGRGLGGGTGSTIIDLLLSGAAGNSISRDVDCEDRAYALPTFSRGLNGQIGTRYEWRNEQDNDYGYFTPTREYDQGQNTCRDFTATTYRNGQEMRRQGSACRYPDGRWHLQ